MNWMAAHDQRMQVFLRGGGAALVVVLVMTMTGASALALSNGGGGGGSSSAGDFGSRIEAFRVIERALNELGRVAREVEHAVERALSREHDWDGGRGPGDRNTRGR